MREVVALVGATCRWEHAGQRFFDGEVEPCINGRTVAVGAYFGVDVDSIVVRLLSEQLADGGWNCEAETARCVHRSRQRSACSRDCSSTSGRPAVRCGPSRRAAEESSTCSTGRCSDGRAQGRPHWSSCRNHRGARVTSARPTRVHVPLPARRTGPAHPRLRPLRGVRRCLMRIQWPPSQRGGRSTSS